MEVGMVTEMLVTMTVTPMAISTKEIGTETTTETLTRESTMETRTATKTQEMTTETSMEMVMPGGTGFSSIILDI